MTRFEATSDLRGAEFSDVNMSGAVFREADLSGVRMRGVLLTGADIDGDITGLIVNGVEVEPLVEAELDRLYPERLSLRPTDPVGMVEAWRVVEKFWGETMRRAASLSESEVNRRVDGEWSFAETLRHLVYVTDSWLGHAVLGEPTPFHRLGLPASMTTDAHTYGVDTAAAPTYAEVVAVRADRMARVRDVVSGLTADDLDRVRELNYAPGWPPPKPRTAQQCLRVILSEEWTHHQFAIRDLAALEPQQGS